MERFIGKLFFYSSSSSIIQFARYAVVGGLSAAADISVFSLFANTLGINYIISNTASFIVGLLTNYYLSRTWVFNSRASRLGRDFLIFSAIGVAGLVISSFLLFVFIDLGLIKAILNQFSYYGDMSTVKLLAKFLAVFIVLFWNFAARKKIVFGT